jgi:hypothetical protein
MARALFTAPGPRGAFEARGFTAFAAIGAAPAFAVAGAA